MSRTGDVHNLPPEERPDADRKPGRPWLLLHDPSDATPFWLFAYGSSQPTEAALGAVPLTLPWIRFTPSGPHREETNFFPARVQSVAGDVPTHPCGSARRHRAGIRTAFRDALGIGEQPVIGAAPNLMCRGRVVRLSEFTRIRLEGARYAVVITPVAYAGHHRYQHMVPIYDSREVFPEEGDLTTSGAWLQQLPRPIQDGILAVTMLFTGTENRRPFSPGQIAALTAVTVDGATINRIDEALVAAFDL